MELSVLQGGQDRQTGVLQDFIALPVMTHVPVSCLCPIRAIPVFNLLAR